MNILLIQPPHHNRIFTGFSTEPLALETIGAAVPGCDFRILDLRFERTSLKENLGKFRPQVVGITGNTVDVYNIRRILKEVKEYDEEIITVVGGHHATMMPKDFNFPFIDAIAIGMGETTFGELIDAIRTNQSIKQIKGLAFSNRNGLIFTEERQIPDDLDSLPLPRRDLTIRYRKRYTLLGRRIGMITTAKGCNFRCRFCAIWNEMKGKYITKSPERILEELYIIPENLIRFADGNTFGNPRRMENLYELIKKAGLKKSYICDIRSDTVVQQSALLAKWREIGLEYAAIGLESIRDEQLEALNKGSTVENNEQAIEILHRNDIKIIGQFMIDQDFDRQYFKDLLEFVVENKIHFANYNITTPFPGTPLYEERRNRLISDNYEHFDMYHSVLPTKMDRKEFFSQYADLFKNTYTFKRYLEHKLIRFLHFLGFKKEARKDLPIFLLLVIKLMMLFRLKHVREAYRIR